MFSLTDICKWTNGKLHTSDSVHNSDSRVSSVSTDTRTIEGGALFVAIVGEYIDGHMFLQQAEEKGATACLVQKINPELKIPQIVVIDTGKALLDMAAGYRKTLSIPVIAITGSNGKTTTKNFIAAVLSKKYKVAYTKASFNNHIGLPLSILSIKNGKQKSQSNEQGQNEEIGDDDKSADEVVVLEIGTNHPGEIKMLCDICQPTAGVITNIGVAHIENFGSKEAIAKEKGYLGVAVDDVSYNLYTVNCEHFLILNEQDEFTEIISSMVNQAKTEIIKVSINKEPYLHIKNKLLESGIQADHLLIDALLAAAVGAKCKISDEEIIDALVHAENDDGRFTIKQIAGYTIIDDTYNGNPDSVCAGIDAMAKLYKDNRKFLALGKLMEQGSFVNEGYARIIERAQSVGLEKIIFVDISYSGPNANLVTHVANQQECAEFIKQNCQKNIIPNDVVLLKGSKSAEMKKVIGFLR